MISVCMATYNGEKYIREQVDSILCQLSKDDELIVSDDGSTDKTLEILDSYGDGRIKVFHHQKARVKRPVEEVTKNFENALMHAAGDYIFLSDQDDVWLPDKVEVSMHYLENYVYIVSDCYATDAELNIIREHVIEPQNRWKSLILRTPYHGCCTAFRKSLLDLALPFPKGLQSHDRWLGYVASFFYSYSLVPERLVYYRRLNESVSLSLGKSRESLFYRVATRLKYMKELLKLKFCKRSILKAKKPCLK